MSFKPKKLTVAVMMALGSVSLAQAQTATTEKTVITGSNIKRIDAETVAPVDIITREQIERTGLPTIAEVLRNVPANTGGSFNEQFSTSFAPGASGISLRGLGQKTTLVLINGRRTSGYGFAQNPVAASPLPLTGAPLADRRSRIRGGCVESRRFMCRGSRVARWSN